MTCFIVDTYNKYNSFDKKAARQIFYHNNQWWAIKECEVQDGKLMRPLAFDEPDDFNDRFYQYKSLEAAQEFVRTIRRI